MLSRAVLPLTRPNVLASAVRVGSLTAQRPRWYAKGKAYELPESVQSKETKAKKPKATEQPQQKQHAAEQPEFDTKAKPETDEPGSSSAVRNAPMQTKRLFLLTTYL